jgi:uncharacterized membrane protein HdeD (DUF308 family)
MTEKKEESVKVEPVKAEPELEIPRHKCRFVLAIISGSLLLIEQCVSIGLSVRYHTWGILTLSIILMLITIFAGINLFGGPRLWSKLLFTNKIILVIITFALVIMVSSASSAMVTLNSQTKLSEPENVTRGIILAILVFVIVVAIVDYALFLMLYIPLFYLYPADTLEKVEQADKAKVDYSQLNQTKP